VKTPIWIDERDALAIHDRLLAIHGGAPGLRDAALLASALARPRHILAYADDIGVVDLAAAYTAGLLQNHPFLDGNKRTGFVVGILFLELNGLVFVGSEATSANAVMALAAGTIDEADFAAFLRANAE